METEAKEEYYAEVQGPQLEIDKSVLTFTAMTGEISMDSVTARNIGSSAIYYEWKKTPMD